MHRAGEHWRIVALGLLNNLNEVGFIELWRRARDPATGELYGYGVASAD